MAAVQHVYLTAHGEWTAAEWVGEKAQIGFRMAFAEVGDAPAKGSIFTPMANGDVANLTGTTSGTNGTLTNTFTFRVGATGSTENFDGSWQVNAAEDFWTFLNAIKGLISTTFRWTHIKIAPVLADGKYGAPSAVYTFTSPLAGTASTSNPTLPPEVAIALSLRAPVLGRRGRGRMYIPGLTSAALQINGILTTAANSTLRSSMATLVSTVQDLGTATENHQGIVVVTSAGQSTAVRPSEVRVGSHLDVQKRRQDQVSEVYSSTAL